MTVRQPHLTVIQASTLFLCAALATGCFESETTRCDWGGLCPAGLVCDELDATCIHPSQQLLCRGLPDGVPCFPDEETSTLFLCHEQICRRSYCGDGYLDPQPGSREVCDDGNQASGDGCRADCRGEEICGDGYLDEANGEECDDGNLVDHDNCTTLCRRPTCGDGLITGEEKCDDADANSDTQPDACRQSCVLPDCEDGVFDSDDWRSCWRKAPELHVERPPWMTFPADLNSDGVDDVVVFDEDTYWVGIYLNQGAMGFSATPDATFLFTWDVEYVAAGDLDGDDDLDLIFTGHATHLQVALNDGAATFTLLPPDHHGVPRLLRPIVGHFDDTPGLDLAGIYSGTCSLVTLQGNGDGTLGARQLSPLRGGEGCWATELAAGDIDGDGHADFAVARNTSGIHLGQGQADGSVTAHPELHFSPGIPTWDVALTDVNRDGRADLVYAEQAPPKTPLRVFLSTGGFQFEAAPGDAPGLGLASVRLDARDVDGDGAVDLALSDFVTPAAFLLRGAGDGTFDVVVPIGDIAHSAREVFFLSLGPDAPPGVALVTPGNQLLRTYRVEP